MRRPTCEFGVALVTMVVLGSACGTAQRPRHASTGPVTPALAAMAASQACGAFALNAGALSADAVRQGYGGKPVAGYQALSLQLWAAAGLLSRFPSDATLSQRFKQAGIWTGTETVGGVIAEASAGHVAVELEKLGADCLAVLPIGHGAGAPG